jgi:tellurite resistance protein TerC
MTFDVLQMPWMGQPLWLWLAFLGIVVVLLLCDLGLFQRQSQDPGMSRSLAWSAAYIGISLLFGAGLWWQQGATAGTQFLSAYLLEKSLSLDNVFVIALVFSALAVPRQHQQRILIWGVVGVLVLRALLIGIGAVLVDRFAWVPPLFAVLLLVTGVRMLWGRAHDGTGAPASALLAWLQRHIRLTSALHGAAFLVRLPHPARQQRVLWATPLLLALLMVESADLMFAFDSIPAVFTVTRDPFIAYTSNIFAVLGLRALYFALAAMLARFVYLKQSLAVVLVLIGLEGLLALGDVHLLSSVRLAAIVLILLAGIVASLTAGRRHSAHVGSEVV